MLFDFPGVEPQEPAAVRPRASGDSHFLGKDGFGFFDFLDIINPLQHIPIVSSIYRKITGDEISPAARLIGGGLFGGPIGFAAAVASVAVEEPSGTDIGSHVVAAFSGGDGDVEPPPVSVAAASPLAAGAASGIDAPSGPGPTADPFGAGLAGAAGNGLFSLSLDLPAAPRDESSLLVQNDPRDKALTERATGSQGRRIEDLSAQQLAQILAQFQRGSNGSPSFAARPSASPGFGLLPLDPALQ